MITDGLDSIPEVRATQLLDSFKQAKIHFYVIGLGDSWKEGNTLDLQKFADSIHAQDKNNGIVFRASNPGDMEKAMETINRLEKQQEIVEDRQPTVKFTAGFSWLRASSRSICRTGCTSQAGPVRRSHHEHLKNHGAG